MKIMKTELIYKCGCSWTSEYTRGATAKEVNAAKYFALQKFCPKCEKLAKQEYETMEREAYESMINDPRNYEQKQSYSDYLKEEHDKEMLKDFRGY